MAPLPKEEALGLAEVKETKAEAKPAKAQPKEAPGTYTGEYEQVWKRPDYDPMKYH